MSVPRHALTVHGRDTSHLRRPGVNEPRGSLAWRIGGLAGEGIDTAGDLFAKAAMRAGWHVWTTRHFPSRIRGGLTTYTTRLCASPIAAAVSTTDVMLTLDQQGADPDQESLAPGGLLIYDVAKVKVPEGGRDDVRWIPLDCTGIAKEIGDKRVRNTVALGASAKLVGLELRFLEDMIIERFKGTPGAARDAQPAVVQANLEALARGHDALPGDAVLATPPRGAAPNDGRLFVAGNEAFAYGALVGGCRFYAGYPITPATTIMEYLSAHAPAYGGVVLQVEDELAAANAIIGAGFAGVRAMTATSGPGLSLMAEAMGLAGATETPVVIVDCMRPGPSTGMPTKTAQEDITFLIATGHGETPHIVLAAEDLQAAYELGIDAFNLAERYQCAVYVTIDAALALGKGDTAPFDIDSVVLDRGKRFDKGANTEGAGAPGTGDGYVRYRETDDGIPLRAVPGDSGGRHYANSTEHGPNAYTTEVPGVRTAMVQRRNRKLDDIDSAHVGVRFEGDRDASLGVIAFGSTVPVAREALELARGAGTPGELAILRRLLPLPHDELAEFFTRHDRVVVVEGNSTGQLRAHLCGHFAEAHKSVSLLKFDGDPFRIAEILDVLLDAREVSA